ncbi:AAA family ATPase [Aeromonas dhakensis]|uniref:AAA family ATPase n=1 Tax=Aeromonas dhakensis TaxID=196024 RepID=UPI00039D7EAE|nr:AAA family ATPase [Aeromonas dhakensis]
MKIFYSKNKISDRLSGIFLLPDYHQTGFRTTWDDYGFKVSFKAFYKDSSTEHYIGLVRILVNGVDKTYSYFIENGVPIDDDILDVTDILASDKAVSLPYEVDFYRKINHIFNNNSGMTDNNNIVDFLSSICDASFYYDKIKQYRSWDGFSLAIMRNSSKAEAMIKKGMSIASGTYKTTNKINFTYESEYIEKISFNYNLDDEISSQNINLLIGKNGTGKSYILNELSKKILGLSAKEKDLPFFHKLIVIAYSPFENFYTKDQVIKKIEENKTPQKNIKIKRKRLNVNEFAYIGFKNDAGCFDIGTPKITTINSLIKIAEYDNENGWWSDKTRIEQLLGTLKTCINFDRIEIKTKNSDPIIIKNGIYNKIKTLKPEDCELQFIKDDQVIPLSSGQIIYSYMIPAIVAEIEDESILLIDEPELYLHPNLEIELLNMLKSLLTETSSFAIIATHSSLIAREIKSECIHILQKDEQSTIIKKPNIETYGESLESIIDEIFDDKNISKVYEADLDKLIKNHDDIMDIIETKQKEIGNNALAYLLSHDFCYDDLIVEPKK